MHNNTASVLLHISCPLLLQSVILIQSLTLILELFGLFLEDSLLNVGLAISEENGDVGHVRPVTVGFLEDVLPGLPDATRDARAGTVVVQLHDGLVQVVHVMMRVQVEVHLRVVAGGT